MRDELNTIGTRPQDPYYISEEDKKIMREEIFPFWEGKSLAEVCEKELRKEGLWEYGAEAAITDLTYHVTSGGGDSSPGYDFGVFAGCVDDPVPVFPRRKPVQHVAGTRRPVHVSMLCKGLRRGNSDASGGL